MAENATVVPGEVVQPTTVTPTPSPGSAGLPTQVPGQPTTVSGAAAAQGGIDPGNLIVPDIDEDLFEFEKDDNPLMQLMLKAKKVTVNSPEVDHYMLDEPADGCETNAALAASQGQTAVLPVEAKYQKYFHPYDTVLVKDVDGYTEDGQTLTPGKDLMLFVTGIDPTTNNPIVRAVNGPRDNATDEFCKCPAIPAGTYLVFLNNALYETQKEVEPDLILPTPERLYLQKSGMNQVVSDYFDSQKKRIPFNEAIIAEKSIRNYKRKGNRTLWASRKSKFLVKAEKNMGNQYVYTSEGVRWQFKRELQHSGKWTVEELIALVKMFKNGEDVPEGGVFLVGTNLLEQLQCIDYTGHPEITITSAVNPVGWKVTRITTIFGDLDIKQERTLDRLRWSNSGAVLGYNRLVHYSRTAEHTFEDRIEGQEAKRTGILKWDCLGLKGSCHIWVDGEGASANNGAVSIVYWNSSSAPTGNDLVDRRVYYLLQDCAGINANAKAGQMWQYHAAVVSPAAAAYWEEYEGTFYANN
ncbi:MAG: hypothetical protein IKR72_03090 [Bacteroidales bacterium]|nr:hypothetical protein [Bacteroidales bacterium]